MPSSIVTHIVSHNVRDQSRWIHHIEAKHENEKNWQCEQCGFATSTKACLREHNVRMHQIDVKYYCDYQDKGYSSAFASYIVTLKGMDGITIRGLFLRESKFPLG